MGRQVVFFANGKDIQDFLHFAEDSGLLALPRRIKSDDLPKGAPPTQMKDHAFALLPQEASTQDVVYHTLPDCDNASLLMTSYSPVVEVIRGKATGKRISDGRIYCNAVRSTPHFASASDAYNRLARYLRKWARTKQYKFHVGDHAAIKVAQGALILDHHGEELSLV